MRLRTLALAALFCVAAGGAEAATCNVPGGMAPPQWYAVCGPSLRLNYGAGAGQGLSFEQYAAAMYRIYLGSPRMAPAMAPPMGGMPNAGMLCQVGATQCFNGWLRSCQRMATGGSWWVTGAQRCR